MTDLELRLADARNVYAGATRKAARAWALLFALSNKSVSIPADKALRDAAMAIFYNAGTNAAERYSSVEEFMEEFEPEVMALGEETVENGVRMLTVEPFFAADSSLHREIGLGYLNGCSLRELAGLNVAPVAAAEPKELVGLSDEEVGVLIAYYEGSALKLVNLMRTACTALRYVTNALSNSYNVAPAYGSALKDDDIPELVARLTAEITLPFEPLPAVHFGTDAEVRNRLLKLEAGPGVEALKLND